MGGRNFEEEFGQALFFVSPTPHYVARETKIEPDRRLGLQETTGFSELSDERIDFYVKQFIEEHGSLVGCSIVQGFLKSLGFRLQRRRVRASMSRLGSAVNMTLNS